jgi:hypothetical protein
MAKSRSNRKSVLKTITKTTESALPIVNKGLNTVGTTAKNVASASIPIVEKGVSAVYGTMARGFDLGMKGVNKVAKGVKTIARNRKSSRSRSRSRKGGRKNKTRRRK